MGYAIHGNLKMAYLAIRYAKFQGVKPGESYEKQLMEVIERHPEWVSKVEPCEKDIDQLTGDARENGQKVINIHEADRLAELRRAKEKNNEEAS